MGVISVNIDGMKPFNDINGKPSGDSLIVELAQVVQSRLPAGAIAARYGGDEFLVAVPAATEAEVVTLAEAIRYQAKEVVVMGGSLEGEHWDADPVTVTLGLSFSPRQGRNLQALIVAADAAVQQGKQGGGDRVI